MSSKKRSTKKRLRRVSVRAELREEPDWDKFAYALLQFAKLKSEQQAKPRKRQGRP
jgi:hypothetical protein